MTPSLVSLTYFAGAEKRGGENKGLVYFVCVACRNVISHVILPFSLDCHMISITFQNTLGLLFFTGKFFLLI